MSQYGVRETYGIQGTLGVADDEGVRPVYGVGTEGDPPSLVFSTLVSADDNPAADGVTATNQTLTLRNANNELLGGVSWTGTAENVYADAARCVVTAFPTTIDDDGVDASTITVRILDANDVPLPGVLAASVSVSSTGTGNTIAALDSASDQNGDIRFTLKSTVAEAKTISASVAGLAITDTASVTVSALYVAPTILNNLSFETDWDSFTNGSSGDPTANSPTTIARSTDRAYDGTTSVKFTWASNGSDTGANFFRSLGSNEDELWVRIYFYVEAGWSISTVQKWGRFRGASNLFGGWYLSDSKGLAWGFDIEASAVTTSIITKANIPTDQWNSLECHYRRNGDAEPNAAFWLNGVPQYKANGADPAGFGLTWLDGRLYAGSRGSSNPITQLQWVGTLNAGNTGSGTIYLDYIAASDAGRIGP